MARRCEVCKIDLQDDYSYNGHILGKKHLINAQRQEQTQNLIQRSIYVSTIPHFKNNSENLVKFFSQFGEIKRHKMGPDHALVEFCKEEPVEFLLKTPVFIQGVPLKLSRRIFTERTLPQKKKFDNNKGVHENEDLKFNNIKSVFNSSQSFEDQIIVLIDNISINEKTTKTCYEATCQQLNDIFKTIFPNCKTYRFGSTISGLGFKNCDLDLYLDIGSPLVQESRNSNTNQKLTKGISSTTVFAEVKRILYSKPKVFSEICPIPRAKTPIIKFKYLPTNISCDISFKNSLAVHNSRLIKFCLSLDPRIYQTMVIIKYWMCNFELGMGNKMSKYALTLLFLFYLQQKSVGLMPPLMDIKKTDKPLLVEGWEVSFNDSFHEKAIAENQIGIPELLQGFFKFYATYDYSKYVICPLDGNSYEKLKFKEVDKLPDCMQRYKDYVKNTENPYLFPTTKPICLQDPNELNHNPGGNVHQRLVESFQKSFAVASDICEKSKEKNYRDLLPSLFSMTIEQPRKRSDAKVNIYIRAHSFLEVGLPENYELPAGVTERLAYAREHWYKLILSIVKRFFEGVLKFDVRHTTPEPEHKQQKIESETDVHSEHRRQQKIILHCTGKQCLWRRRHGRLNILDPSMNMLTKEVLVSDAMLKEIKPKEQNDKFNIDFYCTFVKVVVPDIQVNLQLRNNTTPGKIFPELSTYMKAKLITITNKTLIHMQQYKKLSID